LALASGHRRSRVGIALAVEFLLFPRKRTGVDEESWLPLEGQTLDWKKGN
jgi:hypothetical protein